MGSVCQLLRRGLAGLRSGSAGSQSTVWRAMALRRLWPSAVAAAVTPRMAATEPVERGDVDALDVVGGLGAPPVAPGDGDGAAGVDERGRGALVAGLESGQAGGDELGFVAGSDAGLARLAVPGLLSSAEPDSEAASVAWARPVPLRGGHRLRVAARAASMRPASPAAYRAAATAPRSSALSSEVQAAPRWGPPWSFSLR